MTRRTTTIVVACAAVVAIGVLAAAAIALGWFRGAATAASSPPPSATPTATAHATAGPPAKQVTALTAQLTSGDRTQVATALALDPADVTPAEIIGFAGSHLTFDQAHAVGYGTTAWDIPVTVTASDGTTSNWIASVVTSNGHLVLLDTRPAQ